MASARKTQPAAPAPRSGVRRALFGLALGAAAFCSASTLALRAGHAFVGAPALGSEAARDRGAAVARRARALNTQPKTARQSPFYSTGDREREYRWRQEGRERQRQQVAQGQTRSTLNYDTLPSIEDIYNRKFTGNSTIDPIGGRKRYTYYILFKDDGDLTESLFKSTLGGYGSFLKYKMSCRDVMAKTMLSPIDGQKRVTMEYPMKEYGILPRGQSAKRLYNKATMVKLTFTGPPAAVEYLNKRIYSDNNILRFMVLGNTRTFKHRGEDNELHL